MRPILATALAALIVHATLPAAAISFGKKNENASMKVDGAKVMKGKSTVALGTFRVAFMTADAAYSESHGMFANGGSSAKMSGELTGIDHATMQKIADEVYADFLKQAAARGYTVLDSNKVAAASPAYSAITQTVNYADSRIGTIVVPTGQRAVPLAADNSGKDAKGAQTMMGAFHGLGQMTAKAEANKAFPEAAKSLGGVPVLGVTVVVNFASFKGTSSSFGSSKATITPGATIDGITNEAALNTSVVGWDGSTCAAAVPCEGRFYLMGLLHSDAPIGSTTAYGKWGMRDAQKKTAVLEADPELYEKGVLEVSAQANAMLLDAMSGQK